MIPRTNDNKTQYRYYHLYSLDELKRYTEFSWLKIKEIEYLDKKWIITNTRKDANNSILVAKKTVFRQD